MNGVVLKSVTMNLRVNVSNIIMKVDISRGADMGDKKNNIEFGNKIFSY